MTYDKDDLQKYVEIKELLKAMYVECSTREYEIKQANAFSDRAKAYDFVKKSRNSITLIQNQYAIRILDLFKTKTEQTEQIN